MTFLNTHEVNSMLDYDMLDIGMLDIGMLDITASPLWLCQFGFGHISNLKTQKKFCQ